MNFLQKLGVAIEKNNSLLCVGLDTDIEKIPNHIKTEQEPLLAFNKAIVDATASLACSYKVNSAFYEAEGSLGIEQLGKTIQYIHEKYPDIPVILDAKRGDIGNTAELYAKSAFEVLGADAVTVLPYMGTDSVEPFLSFTDKGIIIICRSSNPSALDFQDLETNGEPLFVAVAKKTLEWNKNGNCLLVVGPVGPDLKKLRELTGDMFFLVPGIGAQGGDLKTTLENGLTNSKSGLIINSSRGIIYASGGTDFAESARIEAEKLKNEINSFR